MIELFYLSFSKAKNAPITNSYNYLYSPNCNAIKKSREMMDTDVRENSAS